MFHPKIDRLLADLVARTLRPSSADGSGDDDGPSNAVCRLISSSKEEAGLVGALYLQSTLLLHGQIRTCATEKGCDEGHGRSPKGSTGREFNTSRQRESGKRQSLVFEGGGGGCNEAPRSLDNASVGFAPVVLLDFLWWMERRLSMAELTTLEQNTSPTALELVKLLRLLRSVVKHPLVERALQRTLVSPSAVVPPLARMIAFEVTASTQKDLIGASTNLAFLQSITLGRLMATPTVDIGGVWKECVACLFGNASLRDAACRRVCRDETQHEFENRHNVRSNEGAFSLEFNSHPSWRDWDFHGKLTDDPLNVEAVQTLDSILQVMRRLCSLEATAGSICAKRRPEAGHTQEAAKDGRRASVLLAEALALLGGPDAASEGAVSPALVLIAEIAMPTIGATEGHQKAIDSVRLIWEGWFCKVRPLEYGAIASLTQMALMCYGGQSETGQSGGEPRSCPVMHMLDDLPLLAVEMVRVWPTLARTLRPMIGVSTEAVGPYAHGGWAFHLSTLHAFGDELARNLAGGTLCSSKPVGELSSGAAIPSAAQPPIAKNIEGQGASESLSCKDGRVPLGPVNGRIRDQKGTGEPHAQGKGQPWPSQQPAQGCFLGGDGRGACAQDGFGANATPPPKAQQALVDTAERGQHRSRHATAALPRACAELVVGAIYAAATVVIKAHAKRPRLGPVPLVDVKRAKTGSLRSPTTTVASARAGVNESVDGLVLDGSNVSETDGNDSSQPSAIAFQPPPSTAWVTWVIEPLYEPGLKAGAASSLLVLLETLVKALGNYRAGDMRKRSALGMRGDISAAVQMIAGSLVVAILGYAPPLVGQVAEPPCLESSATPTTPTERLGRSLAVLDCLKLLLNEASSRHKKEPAAWLPALLSHYASALLGMSSILKESSDGSVVLTLPTSPGWKDTVAFVHARVRDIAPQELRRIPVAIAVQEVDPLLRQYY